MPWSKEKWNKYMREYYLKNKISIGKYSKKKRLEYRNRDRKNALNLFGNNCEVCKGNWYLEFHHLFYASDSGKDGDAILREVLKHPERFKLLCKKCHSCITWLSKIDKNQLPII